MDIHATDARDRCYNQLWVQEKLKPIWMPQRGGVGGVGGRGGGGGGAHAPTYERILPTAAICEGIADSVPAQDR